MTETRLTKYSHGAGCACKLGPSELSDLLGPIRGHPATTHPSLEVGLDTGDDAGVFSIGEGRSLVQSVDIFTPVVDSPRDWGRIAGANALSDLYAMGAEPLTALQFLAWPRDQLPFATASDVMAGGMELMEAAGCTVVGGHSIDGPEPTYGFAVTGIAPSDGVVTNAGAKPGDVLILTKPLGIGIITTAIKRGIAPDDVVKTAIGAMAALNDVAGSELRVHGATAATDVTGFGLAGHLLEMCSASGVGAEIDFDRVPVIEGALELLERGAWAGGSQRNLKSVRGSIKTDLPDAAMRLLADAQTSGGLLVALPAERAAAYAAAVGGWEIGRLSDGDGIALS